MECLCAAKISVNFGMCFNGTIRRPWVWNFIGVTLKATSFGKVDFINTFLMDFGLLLYISEYSGKTMEECYVNNGGVQCNGNRDGKNSDVSPTTTTLLIVRPNYILTFKKRYISY